MSDVVVIGFRKEYSGINLDLMKSDERTKVLNLNIRFVKMKLKRV